MRELDKTKASALLLRLHEFCALKSAKPSDLIELRRALEQLYKGVTEDSRQSFSGLFARMQFANSEFSLSGELQAAANQLRIICNRAAHEELNELNSGEMDFGIHTLYRLLQAFSPGLVDAELDSYFTGRRISSFSPLAQATKHSFICVVQSWKNLESCLLINAVRDDGESCQIRLNNDDKQSGHDGRIWTKLMKSLWPFATLHCHQLSEIQGQSGQYMSNPLSLVVLEPDFLIDASALATCFYLYGGDPALFVLNHLFRDSSSEATLQGTLVNGIFDELAMNPEADYDELFRKGLAALPLAMVSLGKECASDLYKRIKQTHLPQLQKYVQNLGDAEILLEPSYLCPEYGLQGRLDLLSRTADKYQIVELKSGKAPAIEVWKAHQMQVVAYNLIIRNAYGTNGKNNSSILYSASPENPLRYVVNIPILEQDLLMCRNRIVGIMRQLSENPEPLLNWLKDCETPKDNPLANSKYERFQAFCQGLDKYEWEWFCASLQRVIREIWFVKIGDLGANNDSGFGHNALWQMGNAEKKAAYKLITDLKPLSIQQKQISLAIPHSDDLTDFRRGDIVVLYEQQTAISKQEILRGSIVRLQDNVLELLVRGGQRNERRFSAESLWAVEHDILETSLYSPLSSLTQFLSAEKTRRRVLMGLDTPQYRELQTEPENGMESVIKGMHAALQLYIVQGPPGTGKTSGLLGRYLSELYHQSNKTVLILSFTNRAVDEICLCLRKRGLPFLRTGSSELIESELLSSKISGKRFAEMESIIKANRIWVSTVQSANAWYLDMLKLVSFDEIIVDEASQIIESGILGILAQAPKTILIGDQNQLPPITVQSALPFDFTEPELQALAYVDYGQSLMERQYRLLSQKGIRAVQTMLEKHYRMHEDIASLVAETYQNRLQTATERQTKALQPLAGIPAWLNYRLVFIDCPPSQDYHNDPFQVALIRKLIGALQKSGIVQNPASEIGIVAPFRAMIHSLWQELWQSEPRLEGLTIDTVERFQGSEREIIILCLPLRSEADMRQIESLSDGGEVDRKLNVALSRAKERLIILANPRLCRNSLHYGKLIDKISQGGIMVNCASAERDLRTSDYNARSIK